MSHSFDAIAPHPSPASPFCVPDVVVHPPEEEQTDSCAPFLAFAASRAEPGPSTPDLAVLASRLESAPYDRRSHYHPRRPTTALGIFSDGNDGDNSTHSSTMTKRQSVDTDMMDEDTLDVVEVFKVPRARSSDDVTASRHPHPPPLPPPPRRGLRARLRSSLRAVRGSKARDDDHPALVMPPPVESEASAGLRRSRSARRIARPLSQLFAFSSAPNMGDPVSSSSISEPIPPTSVRNDEDDDEENNDGRSQLRPQSADPESSANLKSTRRRFSFVNLQSLFVPPPASSPPPALSSPTRTSDSLPSTETSTETEPRTPTDDSEEEDFSLPSIPPFISAAGAQDGGLSARKGGGPDVEMAGTGVEELSFEMHLDSLHFDSLSFDVDAFDVSR